MTAPRLSLTVWGCRGSLPVPGAASLLHGGDTSCYEIRSGDARLIVDCGSGMRALGDALQREGAPGRLDVLLSHPHFDHLIGLGFFAPLIARETALRIWTALPAERVQEALYRLYSPPLWPVLIPGAFALEVVQLSARQTLGPFGIVPFPLNHPGGSTGFRIEAGGRAICIVTDHEHGDAALDAGIARAASGADLLLYDAAYSAAEYEKRHGWGHSSWPVAVRVAREAGVGRTLIVHHHPGAVDAELSAAEAGLGSENAPVGFARDRMTVDL